MTDPCTPITVTAADGAQLVATAHGGHLRSWTPAGGTERLWLSPLTQCGPGIAIRGGVPVIFPQFANRGPLPKHGFARDRVWNVETAADGIFRASLSDNADTQAIWPHEFTLTLTATASGSQLQLEIGVHNDGADAFEFTAALHAYFAIRDATVTGLGGYTGENNADGAAMLMPSGALKATQPRDVAVRRVDGPVTIDDLERRLTITSDLPDRVIWNPGPDNGLADVPPGAEADFFCLEPAALSPIYLASGDVWTAHVTLAAQ